MLSGLGPNPYAVADVDPVRVENSLPHRFTVNYIDDIAIQVADIATGNIRVNGPNAYSEIAALESVAPSSDPGMITATFSVQPPAGTWDAVDTGAYAIDILDLQVRDSAGTFIVGGQIGSFIVEPIGTGPDSFGYFASQTAFQFDNIRFTGASVLPSVDDATFQLTDAALGDFQFSFYGTTYKSLFVSSNGLITFDAANATYTNGNLTSNTEATIAALWDDVMTGTSGVRWQVKGTGNQQQLIVQWDRARYYPNAVTALTEITFQLVLSESDSSIQLNYLDLSGNDVAHNEGLSATVGIKAIGFQGPRRLMISQNSGPNAFVGTGKSILIKRDTEGLWMPLGPFSATGGQTENISPNNQISGAIHTVIAHPSDPDILWVGATNGGIWRTDDASIASPHWRPLTDRMPSLSTGALAFDLADATRETVYAGIGRSSSYAQLGGNRIGLIRTRDGGANWEVVDGGGTLTGKNISGLHVDGNTIVISVNVADSYTYANVGIFRSTDGGISFTQISTGDGSATGLPGGVSYDLFADPVNPAVLYTSIVFSPGSNGIYKSTDTGATWTKVSTAAVDAFITNGTSNLELAVGRSNEVYAGIINGGALAALFRSGDGGSTWTQMDTPKTNENGTDVGLNPGGGKGPGAGSPPELIAGGQGNIHFSIVADPTNANIVYVGGDRQPLEFQNPTSIGATEYSGRLFRGDASQAAGSQWVHLTHSSALGAAGGGTASNSAPHADSREMVFDAGGNLIETDDGGIYRRTSPRSDTGDWFGIIGDLQVTEAHDVAWDSASNVAISGNQDTGTTQQSTPGSSVWTSVSTADGGDVLVVDGFNTSSRYSSYQYLGGFRRIDYDASGNQTSAVFPNLTVTAGEALSPAFRTPIAANPANGAMIVQGTNGVYESSDGGNTIRQVSADGFSGVVNSGLDQSAIVASGYFDGLTNHDVLWVGSGNNVLLRSVSGGSLNTVNSPTTDSTIRDLATDPGNWMNSFVIDSNQVSMTGNAGNAWTDITGNLMSMVSDLRTVAYVVTGLFDALVVGTNAGVFFTAVTDFGTPGDWIRLGKNLPNAIVYDMEYDTTDDVLIVGTMGRGAWLLNDVPEQIKVTLLDFDYGDAPASFGIRRSAPYIGRHVARGVTLGAGRDFEADGTPTLDASGDDSNNLIDDEDGVTFLTPLVSGQNALIQVNVSEPAFITVLMDLNLNGAWDDAGGGVIFAMPVPAGDSTLSFYVLPDITTTAVTSWIRVSVTSDPRISDLRGDAWNGEVEDYQVTIYPAVQLDISLNASSMSENGGSLNGTVTRISADISADMVVQLSSSDTTEATVPATVTILAGSTSATFPVTAVDDNLLDGSQSVTVSTTNPGTFPGAATFDVTDYETLSVSISRPSIAENAGSNAVSGTITRNNTNIGSSLLVSLASSDVSEATVLATALIPAGSSVGTFFISAVNDAVFDGTVTVTVTASNIGYIPGSAVVNVLDNEPALLLVSQTGGLTGVSESGSTDDFTVALAILPLADVVVNLSSSNPAELGLSAASLTFTTANWNILQTVTVTGLNDSLVDGTRSINVVVTVSDAASDALYRQSPDVIVSVTNQDDEIAGLIVTESGGSTTIAEPGGTDTITVRLIDQPVGNVVLNVSVTDASEVTLLPLSLTFTNINWDQTQIVDLTAVDDILADGSVVSSLRFSVNPALTYNAFDAMPDVTVSVETTDNEVAGVQVSHTLLQTLVDENGSTDTVLVRLTVQPVGTVVLTVTGSDVTEATVSPATLTFTPANWNTLQTVTITGADDLLFDKSQVSLLTIAVDAANSTDPYDAMVPSVISVTTLDNEPDPPTVTGPAIDTRTSFPTFTWTAVSGAVSYEIWVGNLLITAGPVILTTVTGTSYTSTIPLELARHRVWVRANLSTGITTPWSAPRTFDVRTPPAIQPLARFQESYRPSISWSPVYNAASYQIQIDSRFTAPLGLILQSGLISTSYSLPVDLPLGLYRVWVRALGTNGMYSAWSNPGEFYIAVPPTQVSPGAAIFDTTPTFRWNPVQGARAYRIRIFDTVTRRLVVDQGGIRGTDFTPVTNLALGIHRWNVQAEGENEVVGLWSAGREVYIGGRTQLLSPVGVTMNRQPTFRWDAVDDVFTYSLHIVRTDVVAGVIQVTNIIGNSWTPTSALATGSYRVWVRAVSSTGQLSAWSVPVDFTVVDTSDAGLLSTLPTVLTLNESIFMPAGMMAARKQAQYPHVDRVPDPDQNVSVVVQTHGLPATMPQEPVGDTAVRPLVVPSLMFLHPVQNRSGCGRTVESDHNAAMDVVLSEWNQFDWWQ